MYKEKLVFPLNKDHFNLTVKKNVGRHDVMSIVNSSDQEALFSDEDPAIGHKFGPSYSTHMFRIQLGVPKIWL